MGTSMPLRGGREVTNFARSEIGQMGAVVASVLGTQGTCPQVPDRQKDRRRRTVHDCD